ncbi:hypothetical protein [Pseudoalteromonas sp. P1-30]
MSGRSKMSKQGLINALREH